MSDTTTPNNRVVYCFPDTNFFLHFQYFRDVDWLSLTGYEAVVIVITAPVLRELERFKTDRMNDRRRARARSTLRNLEELTSDWRSGTTIELKRHTSIEMDMSAPDLSKHAGRLEPTWEDDRILAHIMEFREVTPAPTVLLTDDLSMRLKARTLEIDTLAPPEELRLKDELSIAEKKLRQLTARTPQLSLAVENAPSDDLAIELTRTGTKFTPEKEIEALIAERRAKALTVPRGILLTRRPTDDAVEQYKIEVEEHIDGYRRFLKRRDEYRFWDANNSQLNLTVLNLGSATAEDVVLELRFPPRFAVLSENNLPHEPSEPAQPENPWTVSFGYLDINPATLLDSVGSSLLSSEWSIRRQANGIDAQHSLSRVLHNVDAELEPIFVCPQMDTPDQGAELEYSIHSAALAEPVTGTIPIRILSPTARDQ